MYVLAPRGAKFPGFENRASHKSKPTDRARPILRFDLLPNPLAPNKHHSAIKHYLAVVFDALVYGGAHWKGRFWPFQAAAGCVAGNPTEPKKAP